jgi:chromate transporter
MSVAELWGLFNHFLMLSLLAVGGAITTAPDMHRFLVTEHHWLTDAQFNASIAIAQAAPGPNVLFVAVLGWNTAGAWGAFATMTGILLPSTVVSLWATRWAAQRRESRGVRAFTSGMAPITLGLIVATGWLLTAPTHGHMGGLALVAVTVLLTLKTKLSPMWLVAGGALVGALASVFAAGSGWV